MEEKQQKVRDAIDQLKPVMNNLFVVGDIKTDEEATFMVGVLFGDPDSVRDDIFRYIVKHPMIGGILIEALDKARDYFNTEEGSKEFADNAIADLGDDLDEEIAALINEFQKKNV